MLKIKAIILIVFALIFANINLLSKKPFKFEDAMKFKNLTMSKISNDGKWVAYTSNPDRGDGESVILSTEDSSKIEIKRGSNVIFSNDSRWAATTILPKSLDVANAKPSDAPKKGLGIVRLSSGRVIEVESVKNFEFSNDATWLVYHKFEKKDEKSEKFKKKTLGSTLIIRHLSSGTEIPVEYVTEFALDSNSNYLFYTVSSLDGKRDGVYCRKLKENFAPEITVNSLENSSFSSIAWNKRIPVLAYISNSLSKEGETENGSLMIWDEREPQLTQIAMNKDGVRKDWFIPSKNKLEWTDDGAKLFFGVKPISEKENSNKEDKKFTDSTFYNIDTILSNADEQVWHYNDPRIGSNQFKWWNDNKDRTFAAIYDFQSKKITYLTDDTLSLVQYSENSKFSIGKNETKYYKNLTYEGFYYDLYSINLETGERTFIDDKLFEDASLSPFGNYILYFKNKHWYVYDNIKKQKSNITERIPIPFYDVDNDVPHEPGSYGIGGWFENDRFVFINEKYDIYKFLPSDPGSFINATATAGRRFKTIYRIINRDPDKKYFKDRDTLYMHGYSEKDKCTNIYFLETHIAGGININTESGVDLTKGKNFFFLNKAKNANKIIFTRESFDEFPDLWISDIFGDTSKKITNVNPQISDFIWGKSEHLDWVTPLGDSISGYIIKPDNYDAKKKYPVLVYFYERFSEYSYRFYQPRVNHRPIYQTYLADGYVIFVPDIVYKTGRPGQDALDCISSGLKILVDRGIADPEKVCVQGHSWGGYQAAYLAAATNLFKAASAGAPVGNMTSAYSQIRTESGLARQFQYEHQQSRIGGNLWDSLNSYINNSPVFQLPKSGAPLLILHGTVDEAVPFVQGVELFLAYRRLNKPSILIEYKDEPHHPRKYENKLDWQIRMKEWFDYYIFGKPADWIIKGQPYKGN